jgi:hypothetical protein
MDFHSELDENQFNIGEVISRENLYTQPFTREGDEETVSDDLESMPHDYDTSDGMGSSPQSRIIYEPEDTSAFGLKSLADAIPQVDSSTGSSSTGWADFSKFSENSSP